MGRHSKHNTARGDFTYAERAMAGKAWGTQSVRVGVESFRAFDGCGLCLSTAREPLACPSGHLFCKECTLGDLVAQKAAQQRAELARKNDELAAQADEISRSEKEKAEKVEAFEQAQRGTKRKAGEQEEVQKKPKSSFWLPSQAPEAASARKHVKSRSACPADGAKLSMKLLTPVKFEDKRCSGCTDKLTSSMRMYLLKACGHVTCARCHERLITPVDAPSCTLCETPIDKAAIIQLHREGTGFAAGGTSSISKKGTSFQA